MQTYDVRTSDMQRLKGAHVYDSSGEKIGSVEDIYIDDGSQLRYLAISTGGFGSELQVVPLDDVSVGEDDRVTIPYGRDRLEGAPRYDRGRTELTGLDEERIYNHFGLKGYWEAVRARQTVPSPTPEVAQADVAASLARGGDGLRDDAPGESDEVHASHRAQGARRQDW
jgi:sporulation protein YlmC with PRC-barrel domain